MGKEQNRKEDFRKGIEIVTVDNVRQRVKEIFAGVDMTHESSYSEGPIDFEVKIYGTQVSASASVNGFQFASMSNDSDPNPDEYTNIEVLNLAGYRETRGESSIYIRIRKNATKFVVNVPKTAMGPEVIGSPEELDETNLMDVAEILKLTK